MASRAPTLSRTARWRSSLAVVAIAERAALVADDANFDEVGRAIRVSARQRGGVMVFAIGVDTRVHKVGPLENA